MELEFLEHYQPRDNHWLVFRARRGSGGLGDRVIGLLSSCVWALVTQRRFRIIWEHPFPLREIWQPNHPKLPWADQDFELADFEHLCLIDDIGSLRVLRVDGDFDRHHPRLIVEANQHFFTDLLEEPHTADTVVHYEFPNPARLSTLLLRALFQPTPEHVTFEQRLLQWPATAAPVGLQIRTLWNWLDGGGALRDEDLERLFACTEHLLGRGESGVFVSADDERAIQRASERFSQRVVIALPHRILHVDRSDWSSIDDYQATFLNVTLLSRCAELVISHWSNLGRIAAFLGGVNPWITRKANGDVVAPSVHQDWRRADLSELMSKECVPALNRSGYTLPRST